MMQLSKEKDPDIKEEIVSGFIAGGNSSQDETLVKDSELTEYKNIILDLDGIAPRPGTETYSTDTGEARLQGGIGYYKSDGTRKLLVMSGGRLKEWTGSAWSNIGTTTYSTTADAEFVQARDRVWIFNGVNNLTYYDGSTITTYSALTTPAKPTVAPQGTTGHTHYSYRISAFNAVGETLCSTATETTTGTSSISVSNYNKITWAAVSGASGYNVYGRYNTGKGETLITTEYTTTYDDRPLSTASELIEPSLSIYPPESNTTGGPICSMAIFAISRIFAAGNPTYPSRLYYSGVGQQLGNFNGSDYGGLWVDVFPNDGAKIRSIVPFQGGVVVFKDNGIYKFSFTSAVINDTQISVPQLEEITRSFGGISFRGTKAVENDVVFPAKKDGRLAFYSLGNQENYAGSVLRTNELSIKVEEKLRDVNLAQLHGAAGFYFNSVYMCGVPKSSSTTNDRTWILDTRLGAWVYWEGYSPAMYLSYEDSNGNVIPLYATENDGLLIELFKTDRNDNGTAIDVEFATKSFNQKLFHKYKQYFSPTFQFKDVNKSGAISGEIYLDGAILKGEFSVNQQTTGGAGVGVMLPGFDLPGEASGGTNTNTGVSSDILAEVDFTDTARSIKYNFKSSTADLYYKFLSLSHAYEVLAEMPLDQTQRSYLTA